MTKKIILVLIFICLNFICLNNCLNNVYAEEPSILNDVDYSGSLSERSTLTGDWGGVRNDWSEKGIQFDHSITAVGTSIVDGGFDSPIASRFFKGKDRDAAHMSWDSLLQIDTGKLGLWPGGLLRLRGEGRVGEGVNARAGSISPVDADMLFPTSGFGDAIYDLTEATYTQFLSEKFGLVVGVLNTLDGDMLSLAGSSRGTAQFSNLAFQFNPVSLRSVPYKTFGGGAIYLPTGDPEELLVSAIAMNTEESAGHNPFSRTSGTTFAGEVNHGFRLFDKPGKQIFGYIYGDDDFANLDDPRVILPGPLGTTEDSTYAAFYSFEQYLSVESEHEGETTGTGIFGRFGFSDGDPNPIEHFYSLGFGGNVPGRSQDTFGLGFYYMDISDEAVVDVLRVKDEKGIELWYNFEVAPSLHLTPDFQIIDTGLPGSDTAYVLGLRTHIDL